MGYRPWRGQSVTIPLLQRNSSNPVLMPSLVPTLLLGCILLLALVQFHSHPQIILDAPGEALSQLPDFIDGKKKRQERHHYLNKSNDGTFNGAPLILKQGIVESHVHCVGDNFSPDAWKQRSCRFANLCYNTNTRNFAVFQSAQEATLSQQLTQDPSLLASDTLQLSHNKTRTMSIGGHNQKWTGGIGRLEWSPQILAAQNVSYYQLPESIVLVPYHSLNAHNPGHLVWDDFMPIYNLFRMFRLVDKVPLLLRYKLTDGQRGLWASCDVRASRTLECNERMKKFLPLLVGLDYPYHWSTSQNVTFVPNEIGASSWVCASSAVAGIASLTDHGVHKLHGWEPGDYKLTHNHGRGAFLYEFRNFMVTQIGLDAKNQAVLPQHGPHKIVFSLQSTRRQMGFGEEMDMVKKLPNVEVESLVLRNLSVQEQVAAVSRAAVFISVCGGGAVTGMFLPAGASVFLYYDPEGGMERNRRTNTRAALDWDLYNNLSWLRVHWLPRKLRNANTLTALMQHEISLIEAGVLQ